MHNIYIYYMFYLFICILIYQFRISLDIFPNSVFILKGSDGRGKGRCLIKVFILGSNIFLVNFCIKWPV